MPILQLSFTSITGSTAKAQATGDSAWASLCQAWPNFIKHTGEGKVPIEAPLAILFF